MVMQRSRKERDPAEYENRIVMLSASLLIPADVDLIDFVLIDECGGHIGTRGQNRYFKDEAAGLACIGEAFLDKESTPGASNKLRRLLTKHIGCIDGGGFIGGWNCSIYPNRITVTQLRIKELWTWKDPREVKAEEVVFDC